MYNSPSFQTQQPPVFPAVPINPQGAPPLPPPVVGANPGPVTAPPGGAMVPAAVAARQRKDAKKDEKRKLGAKLLSAAPPAAKPPPPAPQNSTSDPLPQMAAPPPAATEQAPTFTPAQYIPPKKGLEYLALGLSVLFPNAPIARIASGFAGGLNEGAQQSYDRREQQAEQQYKASSEQAKVAYDNAQAQRQAQIDAQQTNFANAQMQYQRAQQQRQQGIDPQTGRPFIPPNALRLPLPASAGYDKVYAREAQLAQFYQSVGATDQVAIHMQAARDAAAQMKQQQQEAFQWQKELVTLKAQFARQDIAEAHQDAREDQRLGVEVQLHNDTEANANQRFAITQLERMADKGVDRGKALAAATGESAKFEQLWRKLTKEPTQKLDSSGNPVFDASGKAVLSAPPVLSDPAMMKAATTALMQVRASKDPTGVADFLTNHFFTDTDPQSSAVRELIDQQAQARAMTMVAQGTPPVQYGQSYYDELAKALKKVRGTTGAGGKTPAWLTTQISTLPSDAQSMLKSELAAGKSLGQIRSEISASSSPIKDQMLKALTQQPAFKMPDVQLDSTVGL